MYTYLDNALQCCLIPVTRSFTYDFSFKYQTYSIEYFRVKHFHNRHPKLDSPIGPHYWEPSDFFIFFKISEHRAFKNWAHFHKINYFKMTSYDILPIIKVILLFTYCMVKIIFREIWMILVTENLL